MNHSLHIVTLALATAMACTTSAQSADLRLSESVSFSGLENRLASIESQLDGQTDVQQVAYCDDCGCNECCDGCCDCCSSCGCGGGFYAEIDMVFARAHFTEGSFGGGKTRERYQIAPRFILGYENTRGQGARVRWWNYDYWTAKLEPFPVIPHETKLNVVDIEFTNRFQLCRTDVVLAGGVRFGKWKDGDIFSSIKNEFLGLTMAADVETILCCNSSRYWSTLYGGRFSILGGDWIPLTTGLSRDDNIVVTELYGGVEYGCCRCGHDIYTQLKFEMQNWHSDTLARNNGGTISFVGPSFLLGIGF